jgi:hypothetical protein
VTGPITRLHADSDDRTTQHYAALDREQPLQFGSNRNVAGGCSRPVSFAFGGARMTSLRTMQILGLMAFAVGSAASFASRRVPVRGWAAVALLVAAAGAWACIEGGESSRPSSIPMFLTFLLLAPVAIVYSFRARRTAPDRVAAIAAFVGSFLVAAFLLFMIGGIVYSLAAC